MKNNQLPNKFVMTVNYAIDEEPEETITKKEYPFLSWALKSLAETFEKNLKEFKANYGFFPETKEEIFDDFVLLSYETSPYCRKYFGVKPITNQ